MKCISPAKHSSGDVRCEAGSEQTMFLYFLWNKYQPKGVCIEYILTTEPLPDHVQLS